jgi:hypothetical protein
LQTNFSKEIAAEQHCNSLLCDKFATTKSLFKFSPTKNLNTQQQNNNKNKANEPRIRNHVVKSLGVWEERQKRVIRERHQCKALK